MNRTRNRDLLDSADVARALDSMLKDERECISYEELQRREHHLAYSLRSRGLVEGDRIVYVGRNSLRFVEVILATRLAGLTLVPVSPRLAPDEIAEIVEDSCAKVIIAADEAVDKVAQLCVGDHIVTIAAYDEPPHGMLGWDELLTSDTSAGKLSTSENPFWLLIYSSGTTGKPKGVLWDQRELNRPLDAFEAWGLAPDKRSLLTMPLFHAGGVGWLLSSLDHGSTLTILRDANPERISRSLVEDRITHTFLVPVLLAELQRIHGPSSEAFPDLELIYYGAAPIDENLLFKLLQSFGPRLMQGYGSSETGIVSLLLPHEHSLEPERVHLLRSAGRLVEGFDVRVVDPDTLRECEVGETGEIVVGAPVFRGYWNLPEEEQAVRLPDGAYRTGDGGYLDADGYLYLQQRMKDMIISGGENIFPVEIERALLSFSGIDEAVIVGAPDPKWGEVPIAFVHAAPGVPRDAEALIDHVRQKLARFKVPREVVFVEDFPRTESGKVLRRALRDPYWTDVPRGIA